MIVYMTIDERLESLAQSVELLAHMQLAAEKRQADAEIAFDRRHAKTEDILRRAIAAGVKESLNERRKRRELDSRLSQEMTKLAAAQRMTQESLQTLSQTVDRILRGPSANGKESH